LLLARGSHDQLEEEPLLAWQDLLRVLVVRRHLVVSQELQDLLAEEHHHQAFPAVSSPQDFRQANNSLLLGLLRLEVVHQVSTLRQEDRF
jgi:hypothetical protein